MINHDNECKGSYSRERYKEYVIVGPHFYFASRESDSHRISFYPCPIIMALTIEYPPLNTACQGRDKMKHDHDIHVRYTGIMMMELIPRKDFCCRKETAKVSDEGSVFFPCIVVVKRETRYFLS